MACYVQKDRHIFCSERCRLAARASEIRGTLARGAHRRVPWVVFAAVLLTAVLPLGIVLARAAKELDQNLLPFQQERVREKALTAEILAIDEEEDAVTVHGRTSPGATAFLLENGVVVGTAAAGDDGSFRFERPIPDQAMRWSVAAAAGQFAEASFAPAKRAPTPAPPPPSVRPGSVRSGSARFVENFTRGSRERPEIVLSFDAGSSSRGTAEILDVLEAHDIRTTIFLTGQFIEREPDLVRRIVAEGHEVGNHTWSHPHLTSFARNRSQRTLGHVTRSFFLDQLKRTEEAFNRVTGRHMAPYWRAPFGEENNEIRGWAAEAGYLHVGWTSGRKSNLDALDWVSDPDSPIYYDPEALTRRLMRFGETNGTTLNGGIILMHLGSDREAAHRLDRALPELIAGLRSRGFRLVSVSEMRRNEALLRAGNDIGIEQQGVQK
jgi:peptidoglycan/xylan/chitin deacetylase (PgdA/CDA1 family)